MVVEQFQFLFYRRTELTMYFFYMTSYFFFVFSGFQTSFILARLTPVSMPRTLYYLLLRIKLLLQILIGPLLNLKTFPPSQLTAIVVLGQPDFSQEFFFSLSSSVLIKTFFSSDFLSSRVSTSYRITERITATTLQKLILLEFMKLNHNS